MSMTHALYLYERYIVHGSDNSFNILTPCLFQTGTRISTIHYLQLLLTELDISIFYDQESPCDKQTLPTDRYYIFISSKPVNTSRPLLRTNVIRVVSV